MQLPHLIGGHVGVLPGAGQVLGSFQTGDVQPKLHGLLRGSCHLGNQALSLQDKPWLDRA